MSRLFVLSGSRKGEVVDLSSGSFTIGSDGETAHLVLTDDEIGSVHCRIAPVKGGGYGIQDLGTPAGTFVNGRKINAARLQSGDRIRVGGVEIAVAEAGAAAPPPPAVPTPSSRPAAPSASSVPQFASTVPAESAPAPRAEKGDADLSGKEIGGYKLESVLGRGGMGTVYRATQVSLHRTVALKVLSPRLAGNRKFVEQFLKEARAAAQLHHPNVVTIFDVATENELHYYSMEVFDGGSVEGLLKKEKKLSPERALAITRDAARALEFAESKQLLHRDVKPDNLMLTAQGTAKLADLGLAASSAEAENGSTAAKKQIFGTPHFVSPEQGRGAQADHRSDLYSLGATLFRMLTGRTPFTGATVAEILEASRTQEAPLLRTIDASIPEPVEALVAKLLKKSPSERPANSAEVIASIDEILAPPGKRNTALLLLFGGVAVAAAGAAGWLLLKPKDPASTQPVIIKDNSETERERAARENAQQELERQKAENAFMQVKVLQGVPPLDLASKFDEVAKSYPGSETAKKAAAEAQKLRDAEKERLAQAAAKAERAKNFKGSFDAGLRQRLDGGQFAQALTFAKSIDGYADAMDDGETKAAVDAVPGRVGAGAQALGRDKMKIAQEALDGGRADEAEAAAKSIVDSLAPLTALPADTFAADQTEALKTIVAKAKQILASVDGVRAASAKLAGMSEFRGSRSALESALELGRSMKLAEAKAALEQAATAAKGDALRTALSDAAGDAAAADAMLQKIAAAAAAKQLGSEPFTDPASGKAMKLVGADAAGVKLEAKPGSTVVAPWDKAGSQGWFSVASRAAEKTPEGARMLARSTFFAAIAFEATKLQNHQKSLRLDAAAFDKPPAAPADALDDCIELLKNSAGDAQCDALRARIEAERDALALWQRALTSLSAGKYIDAEGALSALVKNRSQTLLFTLASDGSSSLAKK